MKSITQVYITFSSECKIEILKQLGEGIFYRNAFKNLGFPEYIYNSKVVENAALRWERSLKNTGLNGLIIPKKEKEIGRKNRIGV